MNESLNASTEPSVSPFTMTFNSWNSPRAIAGGLVTEGKVHAKDKARVIRDGIRNHQTIGKPHTLEGKIVRLSDKIAYIHHDMDDAIRGGILTEADVPKEICEVIGSSPTERLDHFIHDIVTNSMGKDDIVMSEPVAEAMTKIRQFMFERVYKNPVAKSEEGKAEMLMETLYQHFLKHLDDLPEEYLNLLSIGEPREKVVCDYVGAMTDRFAIAVYEDIYIPKSWQR